jgi:phosphoribosylformylglycinamidine cyclo-ligase
VDRATWAPQRIFDVLASRGRIDRAEMERTFNMGVGMVAIVAAEDADRAMALLTARHVDAWVLGEVLAGDGDVRMVGTNTAS